MKNTCLITSTFAIAALTSFSGLAWAETPLSLASAPSTASTASAPTPMTLGEVKKIDADTGRITIKHGPIENLGMPGMTMVFKLKKNDMLGSIKVGDPVRFSAEKDGGSIVVTQIEATKP